MLGPWPFQKAICRRQISIAQTFTTCIRIVLVPFAAFVEFLGFSDSHCTGSFYFQEYYSNPVIQDRINFSRFIYQMPARAILTTLGAVSYSFLPLHRTYYFRFVFVNVCLPLRLLVSGVLAVFLLGIHESSSKISEAILFQNCYNGILL